jgi:transcriptional regulator with XRE-family HTH domain
MTTCIRRPSSFWTTCGCGPCRIDKARKTKLGRAGLLNRVSSADAWEVIDGMLARGWTGQAIASSAGIPRRCIEKALTNYWADGRRQKFGPNHSAALVAHGHATAGLVGASGARRRLQGLARQGWTLYELADRMSVGYSTLAAIRTERTDRVGAALDTAIREATDAIGLEVGPSQAAITHAAAQRWPGLFAWEDDTIDDPTATPVGAGYAPPKQAQAPNGDFLPTDLADVDEVAVRRILSGDWRLSCSKADKVAVVAAWDGTSNELARLTGWKVERYTTREDVPA